MDGRSWVKPSNAIREFNRTNVSFVRKAGDCRIDVRFFERGCGETMSSGTGSTGAAVAAIARGWVQSPVVVDTPAGELTLKGTESGRAIDWSGGDRSPG